MVLLNIKNAGIDQKISHTTLPSLSSLYMTVLYVVTLPPKFRGIVLNAFEFRR